MTGGISLKDYVLGLINFESRGVTLEYVYRQGDLTAVKLRPTASALIRVKPTRVMTVTDRVATRDLLRFALQPSDRLVVVDEVNSGRRALGVISRSSVDIVILGPQLPDFDTTQLTTMILELDKSVRVIALEGDLPVEEGRRLLTAGVSAVLPSAPQARVIREAVHLVMDGCQVVTRGTVQQLVTPSPEIQDEIDLSEARVGRLSGREHRVLTLVVQGMTNAQIADEMFIAEGTVKSHVSSVLAKLNLRDRTHAVIYAYEHGLVRPGDNVHI